MSEKTDNDRLAMVTEIIGGADAPPVTVDEFYAMVLRGHADHINDIESPGRRAFERVIELERAIGQTMFGSPNGGFCFPDKGTLFQDAVLFNWGTHRISLSKAQRECSKSGGVEVFGSIVQCVLDYRGIDFEQCTIEVGQDGGRITYMPKLADTVQSGIYDAFKLEIADFKEEGLRLSESVSARAMPVSGMPRKRGNLRGDRWEGLGKMHDVKGIGAEAKIGDQSIVLMGGNSLIDLVGKSSFDARFERDADIEIGGRFLFALPNRSKMTGAQFLSVIARHCDLARKDGGRRGAMKLIGRVSDTMIGMNSIYINVQQGKSVCPYPMFCAQAIELHPTDPLQNVYSVGRAPWLDAMRAPKDEGGDTAAMRLTGGLFWRTSPYNGLTPLTVRFFSTAERETTNSPLVNRKGRAIPMYLQTDEWITVDFENWCRIAKIDYDPTIKPVGNNKVRRQLQSTLERAVHHTKNNATTVEFDFAPKGYGSGHHLRFRASAAFRALHEKRRKHEDLLTQISLREFLEIAD